MFITYTFIYLLLLSSTIFIGLLILLSIFAIQIVMLYYLGQQLFALFVLGVYVGAILVFFVFVVMSFIFFGKTYMTSPYSWVMFSIVPLVSVAAFYSTLHRGYSGSSYDAMYYSAYVQDVKLYKYDELASAGLLLFDINMVYLVVVLSLMLFIALVGSITFNISNLVKYSASLYKKN